jgi:rhodanese-related sulfurtransferase
MCIGVKPRSILAREAGIQLGTRGHIVVDEYLRTSEPLVYAVGDVCEGRDPLTGAPSAIALAGPANRQGRIVAANILGRMQRIHGTYGASVVKVGDFTGASIGLTETRARATGIDYHAIYAHPVDHASYYPGSHPLHLKLLFDESYRILGAQAIGRSGVEKRIDVIATAMRLGAKAYDLADLELCYAPPYGSAKDPVNILGMIVANIRDGLTTPITPEKMPGNAYLIDVREPSEFAMGSFEGAVNIPLGSLREHLEELPSNRPLVVYCKVGQRGYFAERMLRQNGFDAVYNLTGGITSWRPKK